MANSITIHSTENGSSFEITLKKSDQDKGGIGFRKLTPPAEDHAFDVIAIKANGNGTKIVCKANALFTPDVTCILDDSQPGGPHVNVDVRSFFFNHTDNFVVTGADFKALTKFIKEAHFPPL
jgi:hypothetical protein